MRACPTLVIVTRLPGWRVKRACPGRAGAARFVEQTNRAGSWRRRRANPKKAEAIRLSPAAAAFPGPRARPPDPSEAEEKPPSRAAMVSRSGAGPRGVASSAARIAARCAGVVPQQPPMILAPQSRASTA